MPKQGAPTCTLPGKGKAFGDSQMAPISPAISPAHPEHLPGTASSKKHPRINPWASLTPPPSPLLNLPSPLLQECEICESLALSPSPALHLLPSHPWLLAGLFWVPGFIKKSELLFLCNISKEVRKEELSDHHAPSWSSQLRFCIPTTRREGALIPSTQKKKNTQGGRRFQSISFVTTVKFALLYIRHRQVIQTSSGYHPNPKLSKSQITGRHRTDFTQLLPPAGSGGET